MEVTNAELKKEIVEVKNQLNKINQQYTEINLFLGSSLGSNISLVANKMSNMMALLDQLIQAQLPINQTALASIQEIPQQKITKKLTKANTTKVPAVETTISNFDDIEDNEDIADTVTMDDTTSVISESISHLEEQKSVPPQQSLNKKTAVKVESRVSKSVRTKLGAEEQKLKEDNLKKGDQIKRELEFLYKQKVKKIPEEIRSILPSEYTSKKVEDQVSEFKLKMKELPEFASFNKANYFEIAKFAQQHSEEFPYVMEILEKKMIIVRERKDEVQEDNE